MSKSRWHYLKDEVDRLLRADRTAYSIAKAIAIDKKMTSQEFDSFRHYVKRRKDVEKKRKFSEMTFNRYEAQEKAARIAIKEGRIDEAVDILQGIKSERIVPKYEPSQFSSGLYVVIGCLHLPFHNKDFFEAACNLIEDVRDDIRGLILAGDILDMHSISRHEKGKIGLPGYTLGREYAEANVAMDRLEEALRLPNGTYDMELVREYFYGNHEDWYNQHNKEVDASKMGEAGIVSPYDAVFKHRRFRFQSNWKEAFVQLGDLKIIHGTWLNKHCAHKHLQEMKENVLFFHTHRVQTFKEEKYEAFNAGFGGDKDSRVFRYMQRSQREAWRNAFALVSLHDDGTTTTEIVDWKNDRLCYRGKCYRVNDAK